MFHPTTEGQMGHRGNQTKSKSKSKAKVETPVEVEAGREDHLRQYQLSELTGLDRLDEKEQDFVQNRIDAWNEGSKNMFHGHKGVGGSWTMDVGNIFGGNGRGDARLCFLGSGLEIVNHKGKNLLK